MFPHLMAWTIQSAPWRILAEAADAAQEGDERPRSLLELEGLGADLWGEVDAQAYVERLRQEWDGGR